MGGTRKETPDRRQRPKPLTKNRGGESGGARPARRVRGEGRTRGVVRSGNGAAGGRLAGQPTNGRLYVEPGAARLYLVRISLSLLVWRRR